MGTNTTDCGECHGAGYLWADDWDGEHYTREWPCSSCEGTGQVEADGCDDCGVCARCHDQDNVCPSGARAE